MREERMKLPITREKRFQDQRLEKPAGVRQMPFKRTYFRHRLDAVIFDLQGRAERFAGGADARIVQFYIPLGLVCAMVAAVHFPWVTCF